MQIILFVVTVGHNYYYFRLSDGYFLRLQNAYEIMEAKRNLGEIYLKQVLFDSDILLDILAMLQPFVIASAQALNTVMKKQVQVFVVWGALRCR